MRMHRFGPRHAVRGALAAHVHHVGLAGLSKWVSGELMVGSNEAGKGRA
jgi:hypothetical protein